MRVTEDDIDAKEAICFSMNVYANSVSWDTLGVGILPAKKSSWVT